MSNIKRLPNIGDIIFVDYPLSPFVGGFFLYVLDIKSKERTFLVLNLKTFQVYVINCNLFLEYVKYIF